MRQSRPWLAALSPARIALLLGLELFGLLLYWNTLRHEPVWDDVAYVQNSSFLRRCENLKEALNPRNLVYVLPVRNSARPAWLASVLLDTCLYDRDLIGYAGYRLSSILWSAWGAIFLMLAVWQLSRDNWSAAMSGALFLAHPAHTEAVNIISFRTDLLSLALMAASLYLHLLGRGQKAGLRRASVLGSLFCFALALLSKEMAVTLPLLIILADSLLPAAPVSRRRRAPLYAAYFAILLLYLVFRAPRAGYVMEGHQDFFSSLREKHQAAFDTIARPHPLFQETAPGPGLKREPPPWSEAYFSDPRVRALTISKIAGANLRLLFWPHPLQGDYAPKPALSWKEPAVLRAWAAWLALLAAAWALRRKIPLASFGLLWIPISLLPVSGFFALRNLQADRYLYVPSAGACIAAAALLSWLGRGRRPFHRTAAFGLFAAAAAAAAFLTVSRNRDYADEFSFQRATAAVDDGVPRVHLNLALCHVDRKEPALAEAEFRKALALWPESTNSRAHFAAFLSEKKRFSEAAAELRLALEGSPDDPFLKYQLGMAYWSGGRRAQALAFLKAAARSSAVYWQANANIGAFLVEQKRYAEAIPYFEDALKATLWKRDARLLKGLEQARAAARR